MIKNQSEKINNKFDMSPEAIDRRLRELAQLYKLGMAIQKAKHLAKFKNFIQEENKINKGAECEFERR